MKVYQAGPLNRSRFQCASGRSPRHGSSLPTWTGIVLALCVGTAALADGYIQNNLVSDIPGLAQYTDPNLLNPWGMAYSPTSPFWVANNHSGTATIYKGDGQPQALVVSVPAAGGTAPGSPTGQVFNGTSHFSGDRFIFATEDGTLSGWQSSSGTQAVRRVDNSASGASYKGLAAGNDGNNDYLYAANFAAGSVDVFDEVYAPTFGGGAFVDPVLPAGYAPFNIQNLGGHLYVTYAIRDPGTGDDMPGAGNGYIDVFTTGGLLERRLVSNGPLNSPWGLAMAPGDFGQFSNDLLVGNFGDGRINAFDPLTGNYLGALSDAGNNPIVIDGLWGLMFGNDAQAGSHNSLYFTAGISGPAERALEDHGLFGMITPVPEPASMALLGLGLAGLAASKARRRKTPEQKLRI
jgi:uncharacterized protein (TIGR03118 family)